MKESISIDYEIEISDECYTVKIKYPLLFRKGIIKYGKKKVKGFIQLYLGIYTGFIVNSHRNIFKSKKYKTNASEKALKRELK